jgi:saccharopine dehydrogenase (NADP+, L-glutamate forming)
MVDRYKVLLIGSGMMVGPFIEYILKDQKNHLTVASNLRESLNEVLKKFAGKNIQGVELDITKDEKKLEKLIRENFLIVSFIPPFLHPIVAKKCLEVGRHMLTSSYVSPYMKEISNEVKKKDLIFFNEMGLDPGLDHVITHKIIHEEEEKGNKIIEFESWCGALPSPENYNNPFLYKFSWSPRGVLIAMNNSVNQLINGTQFSLPSEKTLINTVKLDFHPTMSLEGYYNRDSFPYKETYNLKDAQTVVRGTLRYKGTAFAFQSLKNLGLLSTNPIDKNIKTFKDIIISFIRSTKLKNCLDNDIVNFSLCVPEIENKVESKFLLNLSLFNLSNFETSYIDNNGGYESLLQKAYSVYHFLDLHKDSNIIKNYDSILDATSVLLEEKLKMNEGERDMDFMHNRFTILTKSGEIVKRTADLLVFGNHNNSEYSATAITVGTPAAIVSQRILDGKIKGRGVLTPTCPILGKYILSKLEENKIYLHEKITRLVKF